MAGSYLGGHTVINVHVERLKNSRRKRRRPKKPNALQRFQSREAAAHRRFIRQRDGIRPGGKVRSIDLDSLEGRAIVAQHEM
jgi:hypothetical protein